jgi:uncharacterized protein YqgV (UPF0045/DUF77 family)
MLTELSVIPVRGNPDSTGILAAMIAEIDAAGLPYQLSPTSICIDGEWDHVMKTVKACHAIARRDSSHVVTLLKIEDDANATNKLKRFVAEQELIESVALDDAPLEKIGDITEIPPQPPEEDVERT